MISYFIFKDINSIDKGIILRKTPVIPRAKRRVESIIVPGRNGELYQDQETYETISIQIECSILENTDISKIKSWLNGEGKIVFSNNSNRYYNANIINQIDYTSIANQIYEFPLQLELQPISYSLKEKEVNIVKSSTIVITESTYKIKPCIKVEGSGNVKLTINNKSMILNNIEEYIELDCELEEAYRNDINCNSKVLCEDFFELKVGENNISFEGNVSNIQIKYREAFL